MRVAFSFPGSFPSWHSVMPCGSAWWLQEQPYQPSSIGVNAEQVVPWPWLGCALQNLHCERRAAGAAAGTCFAEDAKNMDWDPLNA